MKTDGKNIIAENDEDYIKLLSNIKKLEDLRLTINSLGKEFKCEKQYGWVRSAIIEYRKSKELSQFIILEIIESEYNFDYDKMIK